MATFGLSTHILVQHKAAALHFPRLIKNSSFLLLEHKTSGNQILGILTLFPEKVQTEFGFFFFLDPSARNNNSVFVLHSNAMISHCHETLTENELE